MITPAPAPTWALDLATRTGWALRTSSGRIHSGTWDLAPRRGDSPGMRYVYLRARLEDMQRAWDTPGLVTYEDALMRGPHAREVLYGLRAVLLEWCAERGVDHRAVNTATLRRYCCRLTGRKGTLKELDCAAASKLTGREITDDNEADAVCLLHVEV